MRKLLFTLLAATFFCGYTHAGFVPGYMGKKFSVGINASSFFMFEDFNSISDAIMSTRFSYKSELALSYTVGRKISLGGSFYYGKQKYNVGERYYYRNSNSNGTYVLPEDEYMYGKIMIFEFNAKFYQRNFIAPIGPYHQFSIGVVKYNAKAPGDSLVLVSSENDNIVIDVLEVPEDPFSCVKLSYHIGYSAPVFKNCYFNFAFGLNFFRGGDSAKVKTDSYTKSNYIQGMLNRQIRRHNCFEFKIGFGWLAF